ncbi:MAG: class SAM-dependent methyltransferase [Frankiales bacterium]|nr:class SAM-dependent methyltransferase [Frankiales bacterium]
MDSRRALSFGAAADVYALARPTYPVDAVRWCLPPDATRVLDLGAGTGKLTSVLLGLGIDVVAVEPDDEMRARIDPRATALEGSAEQIPLSDGLFDAVVVGQAWHWFDREVALAEVTRVLRPGGTLGLLWNLINDAEGWPLTVAEVVGMEDRASFVQESDSRPYDEQDGLEPWARELFRHTQVADAELVVANIASRSSVILLPAEDRDALLERVRHAVPEGRFLVPWVTDAWRAVRPG